MCLKFLVLSVSLIIVLGNNYQPPRNLSKSDVPYIISIIFRGDSEQTIDDYDLCKLEQLFSYKRKNPNGCPIKATFLLNKPTNNSAINRNDKCVLKK